MSGILERLAGMVSPAAGEQFRLHAWFQRLPSGSELDLRTTDARAVQMKARLYVASEQDLCIGLPVVGEQRTSLRTGEKLDVILPAGAPLPVARTAVLGRVRVRGPEGMAIPGYRLEMPGPLSDRDAAARVRDEAPEHDRGPTIEAELRTIDAPTPVRGVLVDLTEAGVTIRSRNALNRTRPGDHMHLRCDLPAPVGSIDVPVSIIRVDPDQGRDTVRIAARFRDPIEGMGELVKRGVSSLIGGS